MSFSLRPLVDRISALVTGLFRGRATHDSALVEASSTLPSPVLPITVAEAMLLSGLADRLGMSQVDALRAALAVLVEMSGDADAHANAPSIPSIARLSADIEALRCQIACNDAGNRRAFELIYESVETIRSDFGNALSDRK